MKGLYTQEVQPGLRQGAGLVQGEDSHLPTDGHSAGIQAEDSHLLQTQTRLEDPAFHNLLVCLPSLRVQETRRQFCAKPGV